MIALLLLAFPLYIFAYPNELVLLPEEKVGEVVKSLPPRKTRAQLPENFDYRPKGLLTTDLNQHIPVYWYEFVLKIFCFC
jgi:hypothetical protein